MADALRTGSFGLGRGLGALIPSATSEGTDAQEIAISRIAPNPHQPRTHFSEAALEGLADSIREQGLLQPLVVRATADGNYQLIAGERRLRAARLAGLTHVPAVIRSTDEGEMLQLALIENLQRSDLNPLEEALAFEELSSNFGLTHEQIARQVGRSRTAVTNAIRLLDLSEQTRAALLEGTISEGHGRALAALSLSEIQDAALAVVIERGLSVRQTEELVRRRGGRGGRRAATADESYRDLEERLRTLLATRVSITRTRRGGRVVIEFGTNEELERIAGMIDRPAPSVPSPTVWTR